MEKVTLSWLFQNKSHFREEVGRFWLGTERGLRRNYQIALGNGILTHLIITFQGGGSHNLVVGPYHLYPGVGGFVTGVYNTIEGAFASVSGGYYNHARGWYSSVSGGVNNIATEWFSTASGGYGVNAAGYYNWAAGGLWQDR